MVLTFITKLAKWFYKKQQKWLHVFKIRNSSLDIMSLSALYFVVLFHLHSFFLFQFASATFETLYFRLSMNDENPFHLLNKIPSFQLHYRLSWNWKVRGCAGVAEAVINWYYFRCNMIPRSLNLVE